METQSTIIQGRGKNVTSTRLCPKSVKKKPTSTPKNKSHRERMTVRRLHLPMPLCAFIHCKHKVSPTTHPASNTVDLQERLQGDIKNFEEIYVHLMSNGDLSLSKVRRVEPEGRATNGPRCRRSRNRLPVIFWTVFVCLENTKQYKTLMREVRKSALGRYNQKLAMGIWIHHLLAYASNW